METTVQKHGSKAEDMNEKEKGTPCACIFVYFCYYTIVIIDFIVFISTSSTAQGGGESFKHRKPIGAVRCCESRMAERSH